MKFDWTILADYSYASTQVNLPEAEAQRIIEWGKENIPDDELYEDPEDDTMGREDTVHCTVLYGLVDQDPEPVRELLSGTGTIKATLGKISLFEQDDYDVVKIAVKSPDLHRLHKKLSDNLENENSFPEYTPHVTIAYVKPGSGKPFAGSTEFENTELSFSKVRFSTKTEEVTWIALGSVAAQLNWRV
jgi:2'-5' RNA ligase